MLGFKEGNLTGLVGHCCTEIVLNDKEAVINFALKALGYVRSRGNAKVLILYMFNWLNSIVIWDKHGSLRAGKSIWSFFSPYIWPMNWKCTLVCTWKKIYRTTTKRRLLKLGSYWFRNYLSDHIVKCLTLAVFKNTARVRHLTMWSDR